MFPTFLSALMRFKAISAPAQAGTIAFIQRVGTGQVSRRAGTKRGMIALQSLHWSNTMGSSANAFTFPAGFRTERIQTNGATIHVRTGGTGPRVVLLHGYGETGDMW